MTPIVLPNGINPYNIDKCDALIQKIGHCRQCHNKKKGSWDFCGVHQKATKVTRYTVFLNKLLPNNQEDDNYDNKISFETPKFKKIKILDEEESGLPNSHEIKKWNIKELREHIKNRNIQLEPRQRKDILCKKLIEHYSILDKFSSQIGKVVKAQAMIRGYLMRYRNRCVNKTDIYTLDHIFEIPNRYFFQFRDSDGFYYGFDIRSFKKMIEANPKKEITNPYNWKPISQEILLRYKTQLSKILISSVGMENIKDDKYTLSDEKKLEQYMIDVFHKFDMLDNYTDHTWFLNLSMHQLKKLYKECEDIWNYRAALTIEAKNSLLYDGHAFRLSVHSIFNIPETPKNKMKLQKILLRDFERLVTEGKDINDRKTGSKLMLTGLCMVSELAAQAYPYLVWSMAEASN